MCCSPHLMGWPRSFCTATLWCGYHNYPILQIRTLSGTGGFGKPLGAGRGRAVFEPSWTGSGKHLLRFHICGLQVAAADLTHSLCTSTGLGGVPRLQLRQHWMAACLSRERLKAFPQRSKLTKSKPVGLFCLHDRVRKWLKAGMVSLFFG